MAITTDKNEPIILTPNTKNVGDKVQFVTKLYDHASEKINHFDQLRQRNLALALVAFSAVLAFVAKSNDPVFQSLICLGVSIMMIVFIRLDDRLHRYTHGFRSSMYVFSKVIRDLLNKEERDVAFYKYNSEGEKSTEKWYKHTHGRIFLTLAVASFVLCLVAFTKIK